MATLIYIHGFNSSPESAKAKILEQCIDQLGIPIDRYLVPNLAYEPDQAVARLIDEIETLLSHDEDVYLVGSSLGGFYATHLAERYGLKATLINPAVKPYELLVDYLGLNKNIYTGEEYEITLDHMEQLKSLDVPSVSDPTRILLMVQTEDETLNYKEATDKFWQSPSVIEFGGSHGFDHFQTKLQAIGQFFRD